MPSREETVSQLQESAGALILCGMDDLAEIFKQRSAQVAAMRCETCKKDAVYTGIDEWMACPWNGSGGCFRHEPKEVSNAK